MMIKYMMHFVALQIFSLKKFESEKQRTNSLNRPVKKKAFSFSYTKPDMSVNNEEQRPTSAAGHHHKKPDTSGTGTNISAFSW